MLRSMFTAISSLKLHQAYMDVVADNLSNANTYGFKSNRVTFQDQFSQTLWIGSAPVGNIGGINPAQVGLGVRMGSISANFEQGALQSTGRHSDLAVQGDGFFIYSEGGKMHYSRDGALSIDAGGYLVNSATGQRIQGWKAVDNAGTLTIDTGMPIGDLDLPLDATLARTTTLMDLGGNLDSSTAIGDSYTLTTGVYDSLGVIHTVTITYTHTADNTWDWAASGSGASGSGTLTFDNSGQYQAGTGTITVPGTGGASATTVNLDFTGMTQLATASDLATVYQNGLMAGNFTGFFITPETGEIYGVYSNGMQQLVGQVALATFVNPDGLIREGQNLYQNGVNSGDPVINAPGVGTHGSVVSGYLEGSNVDLAQEFTNMILAQRGFQASSRVITTSDELLQELVNIKR